MAYSVTTIPTAEIEAQAADKPIFFAKNALRDRTADPRWIAGSLSWNGTNVTAPYAPSWWAHTGHMLNATRPIGSNVTQMSLVFELNPNLGNEVDSLLIAGHNFHEVIWRLRIRLIVADDRAFTTNVATLTTFDLDNASIGFSKRRLVSLNLSDGTSNRRLSSIQYIAIVIDRQDAGNFAVNVPRIAEVFLGRRRQMARKHDSPGDDRAEAIEFADFVSDDGDTTRITRVPRRRELDLEWTSDSTDTLNDVQTWRNLWLESHGHGRTFWYMRAPHSEPQDVCLMQDPSPKLQLEQLGPNLFTRRLAMVEQPVFVSSES